MRRIFAFAASGLMLSTPLIAGPGPGPLLTSVRLLSDPETYGTVQEPGVSGVPQLPETPQIELRGFGGFDEAPEGTQQAGNAAMRYLRRGAVSLRESLRQLEEAAVAGDAMASATARRNCRLLLETMRENNPSDIMSDDIDLLDRVLADPQKGSPGVALARLQRGAMNFRFLYPSTDLEREVASIDQMIREHQTQAALAEAQVLRRAVNADPTAAPFATLEHDFAAAVKLLDARQTDAGVRQIRAARGALEAVHTGGLLGEAIWYLDRSVDALDQGLLEIARVSADNADAFLAAAAQEAPSLAEPLAVLRDDTARISRTIASGQPPVPPAEVRDMARRVQALSPAS